MWKEWWYVNLINYINIYIKKLMYVKYYIQNSYFLIIMIELETNKRKSLLDIKIIKIKTLFFVLVFIWQYNENRFLNLATLLLLLDKEF